MTKPEIEAMKQLLNDKSIVIRPSDKGSGITVLDADKYVSDIENELLDYSTYQQIEGDTVKRLENKMKINRQYVQKK